MTKILTDNVIPELKEKVKYANFRTYVSTPDSNGILNIVDTSLPSTPIEGLVLIIRPSSDVTNPKISLNGGLSYGISLQHTGSANPQRPDMSFMAAGSNYLVVWTNNYWRAMNTPAPITTNDITNGAVTTAKIVNNNVTADKLALSGMYSPYYGNNISVANDTTAGWRDVFGKTGSYLVYYNQAGKFTNQPSQYGWLETFIAGTEVYQRWYDQSNGPIRYRGGNATGWYGGTTSAGTWKRILDSSNRIDFVYPVGSIYMSATLDTAAKVASALGGGTWTAWGTGKVPVGVSTGESEFNTVGKTGGSKTVTLTAAQMPSHTHDTEIFRTTLNSSVMGSGSVAAFAMNGTIARTSSSAGGGQSHNNLQPYITCYMWKRTA